MVRAATRADVVTVRTMARSLEGPDSASMGAGLGFLQLADAEEIPVGLVRVASACGECHRGRISAPLRSQAHSDEGIRLLDALAFGEDGVPVEVEGSLAECGRCHSP